MGSLEGKVALVTGGTSGIGLATAQAFLAQGASVCITGRDAGRLENARQLLGETVLALQGDVRLPLDHERVFAGIAERHGHLDIVFANAGIGAKAYLGAIPLDQIDELFDTNVKGTMLTVQGALPLLRAGSSIILSAGIIASKGYAGWSAYSATKAAVRSLARTWSSDLKGQGIRVNAISPGVIPTPGYLAMGMTEPQLEDFFVLTAGNATLSRNGGVEEVAQAAVFLASDASSYLAGSELFVDGGAAQI